MEPEPARAPGSVVVGVGELRWGMHDVGQGFYAQPTIRGNLVAFVAEGDIWSCELVWPVDGESDGTIIDPAVVQPASMPRRVTSCGGCHSPRISPKGEAIAFVSSFEGPAEVISLSCQRSALPGFLGIVNGLVVSSLV